MKPTNYHLFDFLDFDTELLRNESLWKAYKPTAVYEKEGDIYVTVPFQKQKLANDMMADTDVPQEEYTLIIRQYNIGITRLFLGFGDYVLTDESEMLQFSDRIQKVPLFIKEQKGKWILSSVLIISLTSTFLTNKTIKIIIAILLLITLIITLYFNLI
mgnify:CR=1 FL=1